MRKTIYILFFVLLACYSCLQKNTQEKTIIVDTFSQEFEVREEIPVITPRFLSLIQHIDSSGYFFDTLRYMHRESDKMIEVDKYILFETDKESTIPYIPKSIDEDDDIYAGLLDGYDSQFLEKAHKVIFYYFKKIEPQIVNGSKWYPDGTIEEWTFDNETDAKKAAQELIDSPLELIYFNKEAFVCQKDNNMYIFYSRASSFYDPQKKFFNWFVAQNNIETCNISHYK